MPDRKELGLSSQDYEDALNLEKIYALINANPKCSECRKRKSAYVDLNRVQLVCEICGRKRENCKPAGAERLTNSDIKKFERRYKRGGSSPSKALIKEPKRDRSSRNRRAPSVTSSSPSESSSEYETPPPSTRKHHQSPQSRRMTTTQFNEDNVLGEITSTPGMRNIIMGPTQAHQQPPQVHSQPTSPQFSGQYQTRFPASYSPGPYPNYNATQGQSHYTQMQPNPPFTTTTPAYPSTMNNNFPSSANYYGYGNQFPQQYNPQVPSNNTFGTNFSTMRQNYSNFGGSQSNNYPPNSPFQTGQSPPPFYAKGTQNNFSNQPNNFPLRIKAPEPFHTPNTGSRNPFAPQNTNTLFNNHLPISSQPPYSTPFSGTTINYNPYSMY